MPDNSIPDERNGQRELDAEAIRRTLAGETDAFAALVARYERMVYNLAYSRTGSREDALDASQECFLRAWRALPSFRLDSSFPTWLYRICLNHVLDGYRKKKRRGGETDLDQAQAVAADSRYDPQEAVAADERAEAVRRAIRQLPEDHRTIIVMRDMEDMTYAQIGEALGLGEGTVKSRLNRARASLRKLLENDGELF